MERTYSVYQCIAFVQLPCCAGPYVNQLPLKPPPVMNEARAREGWKILPDPTHAVGSGHMVETREWMADGKCNGMRHKRGQNMLTWQVIRGKTVTH